MPKAWGFCGFFVVEFWLAQFAPGRFAILVALSGQLQVVRMPSGRLVKSMACGKEHCIVVTYDGNAYAWGKGDKAGLSCFHHLMAPCYFLDIM